MQEKGASENHQVNNLKVVIDFAKYLGGVTFYEVKKRDELISFLNKKMKNVDVDPERRWITTGNHYLNRIKLFFRWLHNYHSHQKKDIVQDIEEWVTPEFCKIKTKQSKRLSPYSESELWEREELHALIKYEPSLRNKAILSLMWDLNARPHEITLLQSSINRNKLTPRSDIIELLRSRSNLTGNTLLRRAQTIISWFRWISNNLQIVKVEPNGSIRLASQLTLN